MCVCVHLCIYADVYIGLEARRLLPLRIWSAGVRTGGCEPQVVVFEV